MNLDNRALNEQRVFDLVQHRLRDLFSLFERDGVTEVAVNGPREIWVTEHGRRHQVRDFVISEETVASALRELASGMGGEARAETAKAIVSAKMPGYRFAGLLWPTASKGSAISIRKHASRVFTLDEYVAQGSVPAEMAQLIRGLVVEGANMLVTGSTDTGKTTLLNAVSREIPSTECVVSIEDTRELQLIVPNWRPLETNAQKELTATRLLEFTMRSSPDRIILGELRGAEAAVFLEAANTGHHGCMASLHCNSAFDALARLEVLTLRAGLDWPLQAIRQQIASTIQVVIHMARVEGRRVLNEVARIRGVTDSTGKYDVEFLFQRPAMKGTQ